MTNQKSKLLKVIKEAESRKIAIGHFNVSDCVGLKGIFKAAQELGLPVIIGVSEGEREFIGTKRIADAVKSIREEFSAKGGSASGGNWPIFLTPTTRILWRK